MMNKKNLIILLGTMAAAVACSVGVGVTLAYLGAKDAKTNTVQVGHDKAKISEVWEEPSKQVMNNPAQTKEVTVENTGTVPCFVRVYAEFSDSEVREQAQASIDGTNFFSWEDYKTRMTAGSLSEDWTFIPETGTAQPEPLRGYFYYQKILSPGETTSPVLKQVKVDYTGGDPQESNIDRIRDFEIIVYSETVQTTETGGLEKNGESVYGYEYQASEWLDAWKSFLKTN